MNLLSLDFISNIGIINLIQNSRATGTQETFKSLQLNGRDLEFIFNDYPT